MKLNQVSLAGYINYPKESKTLSGKTKFTGSMAVYRNTDQETKKAVYDYIKVIAYDDVANQLTLVGKDEVVVFGTLRHDTYTNAEGETKFNDYVLVNGVYKNITYQDMTNAEEVPVTYDYEPVSIYTDPDDLPF